MSGGDRVLAMRYPRCSRCFIYDSCYTLMPYIQVLWLNSQVLVLRSHGCPRHLGPMYCDQSLTTARQLQETVCSVQKENQNMLFVMTLIMRPRSTFQSQNTGYSQLAHINHIQNTLHKTPQHPDKEVIKITWHGHGWRKYRERDSKRQVCRELRQA